MKKFTHVLLICMAMALPYTAQAAGEVSVSGTTILRDGKPWVAKGVILVGMVAPAQVIKGKFAQARQHFSAAELEAVKNYGADLIRFNISQAGTDPQSSIYSADYVNEVIKAVALARQMGFSIIVTVQSESPSGLDEGGMPSESTLRSWNTLAPLLKPDQGVMLNLFNEPMEGKVASHKGKGGHLDWDFWSSTTQPLIDEVRKLGAKNVVIVDGLWAATTFKDAPDLKDPLGQIIYAVHPYVTPRNKNASDWDESFGNFARTHAVMATAFNGLSNKEKECFNGPDYYTPIVMANLYAYLRDHHIGSVGWALDYPGTLIKDFNGNLTSYTHFTCNPGAKPQDTYGMGEMLHHYFVTEEILTWHTGE